MNPGCYGKLPIHADFIRHNAATPEVTALDEWLQQGIVLAREKKPGAWEAEFGQAPPHRFVFRPNRGPRALVGVWMPGRDRGGRLFPFTVFTTIDAAQFEREPHMIPLAYEPFLDRAADIARQGAPAVKDLLGLVEGLRPMAPEDRRSQYRDGIASRTAGELWPSLLGSFENPAKYLLVQNLLDVIWSARGAPPKTGLEFPVSGALSAAFWLDAACRTLNAASVPPLLFWNDRSLCLFLLDAPIRAFFHMVWPAIDSDHICTLASEGDPARARERISERRRAALDDPACTLAGLLDILRPGT